MLWNMSYVNSVFNILDNTCSFCRQPKACWSLKEIVCRKFTATSGILFVCYWKNISQGKSNCDSYIFIAQSCVSWKLISNCIFFFLGAIEKCRTFHNIKWLCLWRENICFIFFSWRQIVVKTIFFYLEPLFIEVLKKDIGISRQFSEF